MREAPEKLLKVGELAEAAGVPARTIHFYAEIGLLVPSGGGGSGPRLYTEADARRLDRIATLRRRGHPLKEVCDLLDGAEER